MTAMAATVAVGAAIIDIIKFNTSNKKKKPWLTVAATAAVGAATIEMIKLSTSNKKKKPLSMAVPLSTAVMMVVAVATTEII